ncbi:CYTH and CHAD domain-containing protein [Nakamurella sp. GG22]
MAARQKKNAQQTAAGSAAELVGAISVGLTGGGADGTAGSATRQAEIETKLEIGPDVPLPALAGRRRLTTVGIISATEPRTFHLDATYYDTVCLDLLRSKLTLRRRTGGPDAGWHLKLPAPIDTGQDARTEVQLPLAAGEPGDVPAELATIVRGTARGRDLIPVARVENDRTVRHLLDDDGKTLVEVADDHVTATRLIDGPAEPTAWRELEAEIIEGTREQLAATVDVLISAGAGRASSPSKLARAVGYVPAASRRSKTAGAVVIGSLGRQLDQLVTADRGLRDGTSRAPDALHDARSAARRIRAILTVYAPLLEGESIPALRTALRSFGSVLSTARDIDVARRRLIAQLIEEPEDYAAAARVRLADACDRRLTAAATEVKIYIDTPEYLQMLRDLDGVAMDPPLSRRGGRQASTELPALIGAAWLGLREQADGALSDPDNVTAIHDVRKSAKTLRYATEAAIEALGSDAVVFASALEEIQETLGEFQDARFATALLASLALEDETDGVAGFIFGRLHAFEQAMAHGAFDEFSDVWDRIEDGDLVASLER